MVKAKQIKCPQCKLKWVDAENKCPVIFDCPECSTSYCVICGTEQLEKDSAEYCCGDCSNIKCGASCHGCE